MFRIYQMFSETVKINIGVLQNKIIIQHLTLHTPSLHEFAPIERQAGNIQVLLSLDLWTQGLYSFYGLPHLNESLFRLTFI